VTLRNTGDAESAAAHLRVTLPHEGLFVDLSALEGARVDPAARAIEVSFALPAGATRSFEFRVIAPRGAGGHVLSPQVALQDFLARVSYIDSVSTEIGTRPAAGGVALGGTRVTPAGLVVLGFAVAILALWLLSRVGSRRGPRAERILARGTGLPAALLAVVVALGFWTLFGSMARRDWRSLSWPGTTCTVLDRRPGVLALRYQAGGVETISTGSDTGMRPRSEQERERWAPGAAVPCWFDPDDPGDILVVRGFGAAYLFALFPLPVFLFGVWRLRSLAAKRRGR
jgi:hypothetical protein